MKTGGTMRDNLEHAAEHGNPTAIRLLSGPPRSIALSHLWQCHMMIRQGLSERADGSLAKLDWVQLDAWTRQTRTKLYSHEIQALFLLDALSRKPEVLEQILK